MPRPRCPETCVWAVNRYNQPKCAAPDSRMVRLQEARLSKTLGELARLAGGVLEGDPSIRVEGVAGSGCRDQGGCHGPLSALSSILAPRGLR